MAFEFQEYPVQAHAEAGDSVYADVLNHCRNFRRYADHGDRVVNAHECTHGTNADIRNAAGGRVNGFYCLRGRAAVVPEPGCRKRDAAAFIPRSLRGSRYHLYVAGQAAWDDRPLYLWDEWVAYLNGADAGIDLANRGLLRADEKSDWVNAVLEFAVYGVAVLMAAEKKDGKIDPRVAALGNFNLTRTFETYFSGKDVLPWPGLEEQYRQLTEGPDASPIRAFAVEKLGFKDPAAPEPTPEDFLLI